jgi:malonate transporter and related proteins
MSATSSLVQAVFPVFALLVSGFAAKQFGWMQPAYAEGLNRFVYHLAFPVLLFIVIARTPRAEVLKIDFLGAWTVALFAGYALAGLLSILWQRDGREAMAVRGFNSSCGNTSMIGIPLCVAAFGQEAALLAVLATIVNAVIGVSMTVLLVESTRQRSTTRLRSIGRIAGSLARNPLMISFVLGFACSAGYGAPPLAISRLCEMLGGAAIPCSLVATGLFFAGHMRRISFVEASAFSFLKLVVQPLMAWVIAHHVFRLERETMAIMVVLSAMPLASTCFVIAQRFDVLTEETSSMMILSTAASLGTLSLLLWWLQA